MNTQEKLEEACSSLPNIGADDIAMLIYDKQLGFGKNIHNTHAICQSSVNEKLSIRLNKMYSNSVKEKFSFIDFKALNCHYSKNLVPKNENFVRISRAFKRMKPHKSNEYIPPKGTFGRGKFRKKKKMGSSIIIGKKRLRDPVHDENVINSKCFKKQRMVNRRIKVSVVKLKKLINRQNQEKKNKLALEMKRYKQLEVKQSFKEGRPRRVYWSDRNYGMQRLELIGPNHSQEYLDKIDNVKPILEVTDKIEYPLVYRGKYYVSQDIYIDAKRIGIFKLVAEKYKKYLHDDGPLCSVKFS